MRHWKLIVLMSLVLAGLLRTPPPALASEVGDTCPNTAGQYYSSLVPFYNTPTKQVTLVEPKAYHVVQVLADAVNYADLSNWYNYNRFDSNWSPSCRYFVFSLGTATGTDTILWDSVAQKQIGTLHYPGKFDPPHLDWSASDNYLVAENDLGEFLWKVATNEQIQLNAIQAWYYIADYTWDFPHGQTLMFDGSFVVAFDLNTGKAIRKYPSPFGYNLTHYAISSDGRTLRIWDPDVARWSVSFDRATGAVLDAYAEPYLSGQDVQFSPDRHYLVITGEIVEVFAVSDGESQTGNGWQPILSFWGGYYTWHFVDSTTLEFDFTRTGQRQVISLVTGKVE